MQYPVLGIIIWTVDVYFQLICLFKNTCEFVVVRLGMEYLYFRYPFNYLGLPQSVHSKREIGSFRFPVARKVNAPFPSLASTSWSVLPVILTYQVCELFYFISRTICRHNCLWTAVFVFIIVISSLLILNPTEAATSSKHHVFSCM